MVAKECQQFPSGFKKINMKKKTQNFFEMYLGNKLLGKEDQQFLSGVKKMNVRKTQRKF